MSNPLYLALMRPEPKRIHATFYAEKIEDIAESPEAFFREGISDLLRSLSHEDFIYLREVMYLRQEVRQHKHFEEKCKHLKVSETMLEDIHVSFAIREFEEAFERLRKNSILSNPKNPTNV